MNSQKPKKKKRLRLVPFLTVLFFTGLTVYAIIILLMPNTSIEPYFKYNPGYQTDKINIMLEDTLLDNFYGAIEIESSLYLSYEFVCDFVDEYVYWDEAEQTLIITTPQKVLKFYAGENYYYHNREKLELENPVIFRERVYIPLEIITDLYPLTVRYDSDSNIAVAEWLTLLHTTATVSKKQSPVRFSPELKSSIISKLDIGNIVMVYDNPDLDFNSDKWVYIKTLSGYMGYIQKKHLAGDWQTMPVIEIADDTPPLAFVPQSGKINIVWDQMFTSEANGDDWRRETHTGLDVLSPTWFSIKSVDGDISSLADATYVDWAHSNNYQVWALVDNSFDSQLSSDFLSSSTTRQKIIDSLIGYANTYGLDGINIDFENIRQSDGINFVQFMKEACVFFREAGLVSSVDVHVPMPHTEHYNRSELGRFCDYVIIMAYDEHWSTSEIAGSVASIGWVEDSVINTLKSVPPEKVVLGMPFYTFLWKQLTEDGKPSGTPTTKAYGMEGAYALAAENSAEFVWDAEVGQYYTTFNIGSVINQIWLEDERSIELKVKLVEKYNIAGAAGWKRGFEKDAIWDLLFKYLKE